MYILGLFTEISEGPRQGWKLLRSLLQPLYYPPSFLYETLLTPVLCRS